MKAARHWTQALLIEIGWSREIGTEFVFGLIYIVSYVFIVEWNPYWKLMVGKESMLG